MFYCQGILLSLQDSPYTLTIQPRLAEEDLLKPIMRIVDGQLADGIIIGQIRNDDSRVRYLQQHQFPFVTFGRTQLTEPHAFNDFLHEWITEDSVQRLSKLGHQRVALINPPEELNYSGHRLNGFLRGLESCGLCAQEEMQVSTDLSFKAGRRVLRQFVELANPPTAILSPGVSTTLEILTEMNSTNLILGKDLDLIAFEGTNYLEFNTPRINAYHSSLEAAGQQLCKLLLRKIEGVSAEKFQILQEPKFLNRQEN